jgi:hypothetical protein
MITLLTRWTRARYDPKPILISCGGIGDLVFYAEGVLARRRNEIKGSLSTDDYYDLLGGPLYSSTGLRGLPAISSVASPVPTCGGFRKK